jgi:Contractile injection system tube protein
MTTTVFDPALKTLMGSLVILPANGGSRQVIVFQLNPASLRRRLEPQLVGGDRQAQSARLMYAAAPTETIDVELEIDATLQLAPGPGQPASSDIRPQLAALETLLYPSITQVQTTQTMLQAGTLEIGPYLAPTVVFTWGTARAVPVKVTSYSVTEEAFLASLAPIRARVTLSMQVLSYSDVSPQDPAYSLFLAYQNAKQQQASGGGFSSASQQVIGVDPNSLG